MMPVHGFAEVSESLEARADRVRLGDACAILPAVYDDDVSLVVWQRRLESPILIAARHLLQVPDWRELRLALDVADAAEVLSANLPEHPHRTAFVGDLALLCDVFGTLFDLPRVGFRLARLNQAMCPRFHVDRVPCRLVTTYVGPGTEWLGETAVDRRSLGLGNRGQPDDRSGVIRRPQGVSHLMAGDVALLKGEAWAGNEGHGAEHRSPAVPSGQERLVLTLDFMT